MNRIYAQGNSNNLKLSVDSSTRKLRYDSYEKPVLNSALTSPFFCKAYNEYLPPVYLRRFISHYWFLELINPPEQFKTHTILPRSNHELLINYYDPFMELKGSPRQKPFQSILNGINNKTRNYKATASVGIFAISFKPFAWHLLTGFPSNEFSENLFNTDVLPLHFRQFISNIQVSGDRTEKITLANDFLARLVSNAKIRTHKIPIENVVYEIKRNKGIESIEKLSKKFHCSPSKFERNFIEHIGITPKKFSRLIRFKNLILQCFQGKNIHDIIFELNYYDQAHMINDFKQFTGNSPNKFISSIMAHVKLYYQDSKWLRSYEAY